MIVKEKQGPVPTDRMGKAGYDAERQMAFYLRRAFGEATDTFVFNDLRVVRGEEVAQIDHLVLHSCGLFLIESKSVTGVIEVNKQLEFVRVSSGFRNGMQSPIEQVTRQAELLQKLLNDNKEDLRPELLLGLKQASFKDECFCKLVAVSDRGEICRKGCEPAELVKADRVTIDIKKSISRRKKMKGITGMVRYMFTDKAAAKELADDIVLGFSDNEMAAISSFLQSRHQPYVQPPPLFIETVVQPTLQPPSEPIAVVRENPVVVQKSFYCRHCKSPDVEVVYGRYGYYFKCCSCAKNTSIDTTCRCGETAKISKNGKEFRWKCGACVNDSLFYTNS